MTTHRSLPAPGRKLGDGHPRPCCDLLESGWATGTLSPKHRFPCFNCRSGLLITEVQVPRLDATVLIHIGWGSFEGSYPYLQLFLFWFDVQKQLCICENVAAQHLAREKMHAEKSPEELLSFHLRLFSGTETLCGNKNKQALSLRNPRGKGSVWFREFMHYKIQIQNKPQGLQWNRKCSLLRGGGCSATKSCPTLATLWTVARQAPLPVGVSRQEYRSGLPVPSAGIFPTQGSKPGILPCRWMDSLLTELTKWAETVPEEAQTSETLDKDFKATLRPWKSWRKSRVNTAKWYMDKMKI